MISRDLKSPACSAQAVSLSFWQCQALVDVTLQATGRPPVVCMLWMFGVGCLSGSSTPTLLSSLKALGTDLVNRSGHFRRQRMQLYRRQSAASQQRTQQTRRWCSSSTWPACRGASRSRRWSWASSTPSTAGALVQQPAAINAPLLVCHDICLTDASNLSSHLEIRATAIGSPLMLSRAQ